MKTVILLILNVLFSNNDITEQIECVYQNKYTNNMLNRIYRDFFQSYYDLNFDMINFDTSLADSVLLNCNIKLRNDLKIVFDAVKLVKDYSEGDRFLLFDDLFFFRGSIDKIENEEIRLFMKSAVTIYSALFIDFFMSDLILSDSDDLIDAYSKLDSLSLYGSLTSVESTLLLYRINSDVICKYDNCLILADRLTSEYPGNSFFNYLKAESYLDCGYADFSLGFFRKVNTLSGNKFYTYNFFSIVYEFFSLLILKNYETAKLHLQYIELSGIYNNSMIEELVYYYNLCIEFEDAKSEKMIKKILDKSNNNFKFLRRYASHLIKEDLIDFKEILKIICDIKDNDEKAYNEMLPFILNSDDEEFIKETLSPFEFGEVYLEKLDKIRMIQRVCLQNN
ncbi:MAG: hypothetical protein JXR48_00395 [Candidatus Delongbacteria bacterium]|nr:hypothetical protein [Candidatus Delongbacteria bacterium]MBN2833403.1 hypothetical protein [Candidatus Delongbacteria bacterium]